MSYEQIIDTPLRAARITKRLSQQQVAAYLHLKNNTMISRWEKRKAHPCLKHVLQLATLYEVSVEKLFSLDTKDAHDRIEGYDNFKQTT